MQFTPDMALRLSIFMDGFTTPFTLLSDLGKSKFAQCESGQKPAEEVFFLWEKSFAEDLGFDLQMWEVQRENLLLIAAACWFVLENPIVKCRRVTVCEKSEKVRVVTPSQCAWNVIGTYINGFLLAALGKDSRLTGKTSDPASIVEGWTPGIYAKDWILRSADLVESTDLIPHQIAGGIVDGLIKGWRLPTDGVMAVALKSLTGPVHLQICKDGETVVTTNAILMGLGTTWPILSLYNLGSWEMAWTISGRRGVTRGYGRRMVKIVGDDLFAWAPREVSEAYTVVIERTGGQIQRQKDLSSGRAGCLAEQLIVRCRAPTNLGDRLCVIPTVSTSTLSPDSRVMKETGQPVWLRGPSLAALGERLTTGVSAAIEAIYSDCFRVLRRVNINPFLPRVLGGAGFPAPRRLGRLGVSVDDLASPLWVRGVRCALAQKPAECVRHLASINRCWMFAHMAQGIASEIAGDYFDTWMKEKGIKCIYSTLPREVGLLTGRSLVDHRLWMESTLASGCGLAMGFGSKKDWSPNLTKLKKDLDRVVHDLNKLVPANRLRGCTRNIIKGLDDKISAFTKVRWSLEDLPWGTGVLLGSARVVLPFDRVVL